METRTPFLQGHFWGASRWGHVMHMLQAMCAWSILAWSKKQGEISLAVLLDTGGKRLVAFFASVFPIVRGCSSVSECRICLFAFGHIDASVCAIVILCTTPVNEGENLIHVEHFVFTLLSM